MSAITLWVAAALLFGIPLALTVGTLTARQPEAGGLYVWARDDFGPWPGFLCFWLYWMGIVCWFPGTAMFYLSSGLYAINPQYAAERGLVVGLAVAAVWVALGTNILGVQIGKWTQNAGAISAWLLAAIFVWAASLRIQHQVPATPFTTFMPSLRFDTLALWAGIAYGTSGVEVLGLMGGEIREPRRTVPRAAILAGIGCTLFYLISTVAMMMLVPSDSVSELNGLSQTAAAIAVISGMPFLKAVVASLVLLSVVAQFGGIGAGTARLPFAAGADHLMPEVFRRVHPRWATPYISMIVLGLLATVLLIVTQAGDTIGAGYEAIVALMVFGGFLPYLFIFASGWKAGRRLSAILGIAVTLLALGCSAVPGRDVTNPVLFECKLVAGTAAMILSGRAVYTSRSRRHRLAARVAEA